MHIRRHIPSFIDENQVDIDTFKSKDELLNIEWVNSFSKEPFNNVPFWRFSEGKHGNGWLLMAEYKNLNQHKWWIVGCMSDKTGLPEFKAVL